MDTKAREPKTRPVRLADVAKAAGVSHGTASNVFSRPEIVREEVRERVKAAAEKLGYGGPDPKGRLLRAGKVNAIGVATAEPLSYFFDDPFARVVMSGISEACDRTGAGISLVSAANDEQLAWNIRSALVDGFIVFCLEGGSRLVELTRERGLPFVALDFGFDDETIAALGVDDVAGARLAARHLAGLGHRRFAILSLEFEEGSHGPVSVERTQNALYSGTSDRVAGYFEAIAEAGVDPTSVPIYETLNDKATTTAALEYFFAAENPPTAILAMSDKVALIALEWLAARGISVPDEVSVIGFDGVPEGKLSEPPLTTIAQPMVEMGRRAVENILAFDGTIRRETLDVELVVRGSTAAPRSQSLRPPVRATSS
ncbi:MAG TPA: LacI family DNA-binding transcriptional regulator [Rhizobiaceae bacterium]